MKKENISLITDGDPDLDLLFRYITTMYKTTNWNGSLIYFDPNYRSFLNQSLKEAQNHYYWLCIENQKVGFAHLVIRADEVYLNNIFVDEQFRAKGLGSSFLNILISSYRSIENFALNVFRSNSNAFGWYMKLGLDTIGTTYYYELLSSAGRKKFNILQDENGFTGLYSADIKVATLIDHKVLIFNSLEDALQTDLSDYEKTFIRTGGIVRSPFVSLYDESLLMSVKMDKLAINLKPAVR